MTDKEIFDAIRARRGTPLLQTDVDIINAVMYPSKPTVPLAWGAKVSPDFRARVRRMRDNLGGNVTADDYMGCMAWESGETFSPSVKNMAGSGAVGLIQFMPSTAQSLGTSTDALSKMSAVDQLDWVEKYFQPFKGKLNTLADLYMAILWPAAISKPLSSVLWDRDSRPTTYRQNAGLDANRDGRITKAEAAAAVYAKLEKGRLPANMA